MGACMAKAAKEELSDGPLQGTLVKISFVRRIAFGMEITIARSIAWAFSNQNALLTLRIFLPIIQSSIP